MRALFCFAAGFALVAAAPSGLVTQSITLEDFDGDFADRAGVSADAINENCRACHSSAMVASQPPLSAEQWQATITKMRTVYKAPIDTADDARILAWLIAPVGDESSASN